MSLTIMLRRAFSLSTSVVEALIVIVISAIYLVVQPQTYRRGLVLLFPPATGIGSTWRWARSAGRYDSE